MVKDTVIETLKKVGGFSTLILLSLYDVWCKGDDFISYKWKIPLRIISFPLVMLFLLIGVPFIILLTWCYEKGWYR